MATPEDRTEKSEVPLRHRITGRMPSVVAHNVIIQTTPDGVVLSFFETIPPIILDPKPEVWERLQETGIPAECVARITMTHSNFVQAAKVLGEVAATIQDDLKRVMEAYAELQRDSKQA